MAHTVRLDPEVHRAPSANLDDEVTQVAQQAVKRAARARRCPTCEQAFSGEARFCPFDGDPLVDAGDYNPTTDPLIGKVIEGRYEVVSVLGEGGMGTVYEVRHATLGRRFALKVLRRDIADAEHAARFIQEAKAAAAIGHPNIVQVSDFGEITPDGRGTAVPYFVMELLTGTSLAGLLRAERTLEPRRAADLLLQCASGLAAAHDAGVIHRDLKPDNIFITRNADREFVKLLDFGVAKMAGTGRLTRAGMVFGTPHYMSPEQAAGQSVDRRADVYALGVILYECFAGRVPFEADTYMGVLTKHMFATPEPIERIVPDASKLGALAPIAMRCLAKNPEDRYGTMAEVASAIELALGDPQKAAAASLVDRGHELHLRDQDRIDGRLELPEPAGVRPVVGPVGIALGVVLLGLLGILGFRELRGRGDGPAASATPNASAAPPIASATAQRPPATAAVVQPVSTTPAASATVAPTQAPAEPPRGDRSRPRGTGPAPAPAPAPAEAGHKKPRGDVVDPWGQ